MLCDYDIYILHLCLVEINIDNMSPEYAARLCTLSAGRGPAALQGLALSAQHVECALQKSRIGLGIQEIRI